MSTWGMDVDSMRAVAAELGRYAESVERARLNVDAGLARTAWTGPSADAFRSRWRGISVRDLDGLRADLASASAHLRRQAQEQVDASSRPGAGSASGGRSTSGNLAAAERDALAWMSPVPGLGTALALADRTWGVLGHMKEIYASAAIDGALTGSDLALTALQLGISPIRLAGNAGFWSMAVSEGVAKGAGAAVSALGAAYVGIQAGFAQWDRDLGSDRSTEERSVRAGTTGAYTAAAAHGAGMVTTGAITKGVAFGVAKGALTVAGGALAVKAAPFIAIGAAGFVGYQLVTSDGFGNAVAEIGSAHYRANEWATDRVTDAASVAKEKASEAARELVGTAEDALDSVGGAVSDAVDGITDRLNPF